MRITSEETGHLGNVGSVKPAREMQPGSAFPCSPATISIISHSSLPPTSRPPAHVQTMGQKRPRDETMEDSKPPSPFLPMFDGFRKELDEHHDRRERIIKRSRDITAASKKIIFGLQRMRAIGQPLPGHVEKAIKPHVDSIATNYAEVAKDLQGLNNYRYARNITGGNQEYTEAITFQHYLTTGELISYDGMCQKLDTLTRPADGASKGIQYSLDDYVLGLYDMTGELMRFGITAMATNGELPQVTVHPSLGDDVPAEQRTVLSDLRTLRSGLESLEVSRGSSFSRDVDKKADVMRVSVEKVEKALYGLVVRGAERPKGWMPDLEGGGGRREVDVEG
ncbi:Translin-associated protein X [Sphaceloma murrayae]|uniref:Translin-associated protein X n=1 Tax=Sphaceloma murrayae TaxID=2082308 RepID=A0A2K1QGG8_9PEZI|nr:Translin-associated protein X [Sphaceloma murrayae]